MRVREVEMLTVRLNDWKIVDYRDPYRAKKIQINVNQLSLSKWTFKIKWYNKENEIEKEEKSEKVMLQKKQNLQPILEPLNQASPI